MAAQQPVDLAGMLDRMDEAARDKDRVSFGDIVEATGHRSFGALLLLAGLVMLAPIIGDIPGMPTLMGLVVVLVCGQLLLRRKHFWLPSWLLERSIDQTKFCKAVGWLEKPARFVDRILRPRLSALVQGAWVHVIAVVSIAVALLTPAMELVPFSANAAGLVLTAFGLALIGRDGLLALVAFLTAAGSFALVVHTLVTG